jgi:hypothetical protein
MSSSLPINVHRIDVGTSSLISLWVRVYRRLLRCPSTRRSRQGNGLGVGNGRGNSGSTGMIMHLYSFPYYNTTAKFAAPFRYKRTFSV